MAMWMLRCMDGCRRPLLAIVLVVLAACRIPTDREIVGVGGELQAPLELPEVSGDVNAVFDQLCHWAREQQLPFDASIAERVYVERAIGAEDRDVSWDVLRVFLQGSRNPQTLAIPLDPQRPAYPGADARAVYDLIDQAGLWAFEKVDEELCRSSSPGVALAGDEERICVRVSRAEASTLQHTTSAIYEHLSYRMAQPPFDDQMIHIQVLTLRRDSIMVGRSIQLRFRAGPLAVGTLTKNCEPLIFPVAFESP